MRRRPESNRRRGLFRATAVVLVLTAILIVILFVVSSLTAPAAKAPAPPPPTPGPSTVSPRPTARPATPRRGPTRAAPKKTSTPKKDLALAVPAIPLVAETEPSAAVHQLATHRAVQTRLPSWRPYFDARRDAYRGSMLFLRNRTDGETIQIGRADPYVRPVWSSSRSQLMYVQVRGTNHYPGAMWTLMSYRLHAGSSRRLVAAVGMGLAPLGWDQGNALYAVSNATDTSLFTYRAGQHHFVSILAPQQVSNPSLSPDGDHVALVTPADCTYCAVSVFDIKALITWNGPSGVLSEYDLAWTKSGRGLVTIVDNRVVAIDVVSHAVRFYTRPAHLPLVWHQPFSVATSGRSLVLVDSGSGRRYRLFARDQSRRLWDTLS